MGNQLQLELHLDCEQSYEQYDEDSGKVTDFTVEYRCSHEEDHTVSYYL